MQTVLTRPAAPDTLHHQDGANISGNGGSTSSSLNLHEVSDKEAESGSNAWNRRELVQHWLKLGSLTGSEASSRYVDHEFATRLYEQSLETLRYLSHGGTKNETSTLPSCMLKEELGKLYLWGEVFAHGDLIRALDQSDDLKDDILDLLSNIGRILLQGRPYLIRVFGLCSSSTLCFQA